MSLFLDPDVAAGMDKFFGGPFVRPFQPIGDVASRRTGTNVVLAMAEKAQPVPGDVESTDFETTAADGAKLLLRWYTKTGAENGPAVVFAHGGMIAGSVALYDGFVSRLVSASGVPFLSVEFRLAPEFASPTQVEDVYAGLRWLTDNARELGVDPARIAVMGDSGGGNLAAAVALMARDRGGPAIARQMLLYPLLDDRNVTPDPELDGLNTWNWDDNITVWQALLGDAYGTDDVSPYAAPARATNLKGLAPIYMEVMGLDIFRDENLEYARRANAAGVTTELHLYPSVPHAAEAIAFDTDLGRRVTAERVRNLRTL